MLTQFPADVRHKHTLIMRMVLALLTALTRSVLCSAQFELSRLAGVRLELRAAPDASGEVASAWLPGGGHITFLQEDDSLAAQLCAVAAPSKGGACVT